MHSRVSGFNFAYPGILGQIVLNPGISSNINIL